MGSSWLPGITVCHRASSDPDHVNDRFLVVRVMMIGRGLWSWRTAHCLLSFFVGSRGKLGGCCIARKRRATAGRM